MDRIGTIETVCRYPVKSMAGEEVAEAFVGLAGLTRWSVERCRSVTGCGW